MPLVPNALAMQMIAATEQQVSAASALLALGNAISAYIMANAMIQYLHSGMIPAPPPAPPIPMMMIPGGTGMLTGIVITLTPSMASAPGAGLITMGQQIQMGMMACMQTVLPPLAGPPAPAGPGFAAPLMLSATGPDRIAAMNMIAAQICAWLMSCGPTIPPAPGVIMAATTLPPMIAQPIALL